jgi:PAS domain S-box-containing protein
MAQSRGRMPGQVRLLLPTLLAAVLVAALAGAEQARRNAAQAAAALQRDAAQLADALQQRLWIYQYGLRGARGVVLSAGRDGLSRALFARYSASRDLDAEFPGARGIGLIWRIDAADEAAFVARARADGWPDFAIRSLGDPGAQRYVIQYIEPLARNREAIGLDIASEAHRRRAAEAALRSGEARLTAPITLVQARGEVAQAFLLLLPIYRDGPTPNEASARWAEGIGWSYAPLLMGEILASLKAEADGLSLVVSDLDVDGAVVPVYRSAQVAAPEAPLVRIERSVYGRRWLLEVRAQPAFLAARQTLAPASAALLAGLATLLGGALLLALRQAARRRREHEAREAAALRAAAERLEREVGARTADLRQLNRTLRNVLDAASEIAIIATGPDGTISLFNRGAERLLGYAASELVGQATPACFHDADEVAARGAALSAEFGEPIAGFRAFVHRAEREGAETREWTYVCKDGSRLPVLLAVTTMRGDDGAIVGYLGVAQDIRERRRVERMKSEFVATVSHELRTPLTAIVGALRLVLAGQPAALPEPGRPLLDMAMRNAERLRALIDDLLDIEKLAAGQLALELRVQPLAPILQQAVEGLRTYGAGRGIGLDLAVADPALCAAVDAGRLQQILANLLSNAIKFSPDGGRVVLSLAADGDTLRIRVRDQGPGVPAEFRDRLFERFAQHDSSDSRARGGTGLGLAISRELARRMGGDLVLREQQAPGGEFELSLPRRAAAEPAVQ